MITTKKQLSNVLRQDAKANGRTTTTPSFFGDEVWKFQIALRKLEYYANMSPAKRKFCYPAYALAKYKYHHMSVKLNFSIPINVFDAGLALPHYGTIVVATGARIGKNCRIHEGVTIGATNGSSVAASIGNNVFIASGAKIIGEVTIADDVAIAANAVVTKSITEAGTTWGGVPAKKISDHDSHTNLSRKLFE